PQFYTTDSGLPNHTIYKPKNLAAVNGTMPLLVWGNGACSADGLSHQNFNIEIASYGIIVIASGSPKQSGSTTSRHMTDAIDYVQKQAGKGDYSKINMTKIAAAGMSCGGVEAYEVIGDSRVKALGIFNSGQMSQDGTNKVVPGIKKPIFFFLGGSSDIAYNNGMRDFAAVSSGVPTWVGNYKNVGHGGTYGDVNGGTFGKAAQQYFRWILKGETSTANYFTGNGAKNDGWTTQAKSLDNLVPV
ncbi:beta xylanase, partial [Polyplosphaeria fusca]